MNKNIIPNTAIKCDVCIIGGGLVGLFAAIKLAKSGNKVVLCAPKQEISDGRTTALLMKSVHSFKDAWLMGDAGAKGVSP